MVAKIIEKIRSSWEYLAKEFMVSKLGICDREHFFVYQSYEG